MSPVQAAASVSDALSAATDALAAAGVESPRLDAELLLSAAAAMARERLIAEPGAEVAPPAAREFSAMVRRRLRREPVAYILGRRWFRDLELQVDRRVLIPRPETELLVEVAVERSPRRALEVGTGSGAVALALGRELPGAEVIASDSSAAALDVARANAQSLGLDRRVSLVEGMLPAAAGFDVLVANLPYVSEREWRRLQPEIREYEPREALVAGFDGLSAIRQLLTAISDRARDGAPVAGTIALEIGAGQARAVEELVEAAGYPCIETRADLAGIERVVVGWR